MWKHWQIFFQCHCAAAVCYLSSDVLLQLHLCRKKCSTALFLFFPLLFLSDRFHFTFSSSSLPSHLRFLVLTLSLAGKTMLTLSRWQFFPHILPCRWWSSSPSLPTLIWGAVTVKRELEVDKNYSLDLNRCNRFRWWEEGLNFAAAGIFWHLCFLSKPSLLLRKPLLVNEGSR